MRTPASSHFFRTAAAFSGCAVRRQARNFSAAAVCSALPRPLPEGAPIASSTGCDRSSTALTPSCTVFASVSSMFMSRLPKLYGTFMPTCTPAHSELGFPCQAAKASRGSRPATGKVVSISFPSSRREYVMESPQAALPRRAVYHRAVKTEVPMAAMSRREFFTKTAADTAMAGLLAAAGGTILKANPLGVPIGSQTYPQREMNKDGDFGGLLKTRE